MCLYIMPNSKKYKQAVDGDNYESSDSEEEAQANADGIDPSKEYDMTIFPIKDDPTKPVYREVGEPLLRPPLTYAFVGFRGASKTTTLMNLIMRPYPFYGATQKQSKDPLSKPVFDNIFIISPTIGLDSTSKPLLKVVPKENIFTEYDDDIINQLLAYQKSQEPPREKGLIICDDILGMGGVNMSSKVYKLPAVLRHYDLSVCYLTQILRGSNALPPITRNNIEGWFLYKNPNAREIEKLAEEFGSFGGKNNFYSLYADAVMEKPYSFLYLDARKYRAYNNLQELMWEKYDENGKFNPPYVRKSERGIEENESLEATKPPEK